jgi:SnoaL-like domain
MSTTHAATDTRRDVQQRLSDRAQITDLVYRLGVCLDEGRFDTMRELLVEDATVRTPGGEGKGRDALIAQASRNHPTDQRFQHLITNVLVDLDGDRAKVRANLIVHIAVPDDSPELTPAPPLRCALGEIYRFDVDRTGDGWRFSRIETVPLWLLGTLPSPVGSPERGA